MRYEVAGESMIPTLLPGDRLLASGLVYRFRRPQRGEIVLVRSPAAGEEGLVLVKRVIGLPGERISIHDGRVAVNAKLLDEPYLFVPFTPGPLTGEWSLGPAEYFLLGDERLRSDDSRRWGPVSVRNILGRVIYRYAPTERRGWLLGPLRNGWRG